MIFDHRDNTSINVKVSKIDQNIQFGSRVMSIFTKRVRPDKMMLGEASSSFFLYQWLENVKIHKDTKQNVPRGSRVLSIFPKRARHAKMFKSYEYFHQKSLTYQNDAR